MNKVLLRKINKQLLDTMPLYEVNENSEIITKKVLESEVFQKAKSIFIYISFGNEVRTYGIIMTAKKQGKKVYVPKIIGSEMRAVDCDLNRLSINKFGIMEPIKYKTIDEKNIDLCITPGLAFDEDKNRLGYGKGYYDKFFEQNEEILRMGLCYDILLVKKIEADNHDVKMNCIMTEKRSI